MFSVLPRPWASIPSLPADAPALVLTLPRTAAIGIEYTSKGRLETTPRETARAL